MIIANKGNTKVVGMNLDIIYEFNSIVAALQEDSPEIVLGAFSAWSNILEEKLNSSDKIILSAVSEMSEDFIKSSTKGEDND